MMRLKFGRRAFSAIAASQALLLGGTLTAQAHQEKGAARMVDQAVRQTPIATGATGQIVVRGLRGATTAESNTAEDILEATRELVTIVRHLNDLHTEDIASVIFTTTPDLNATFPAMGARELGWTEVPLICTHEMSVPGALQKAVRILLHVNTDKSAADMRHVYLKGAVQLRPEYGVSEEEAAEILRLYPEVTGA